MAHPRPHSSDPALLPLGALLLAASAGAWSQATPEGGRSLPTVTVREQADIPQTKNSLRINRSQIGKGDQELRDIPQSVTVQTERLMDDRNLDDFREVLRTTAGVTFQAGETGEEDVRLRVLLYPGTTRHEVTPVTRGERIASFFWVESMVRGGEQRQLLFEMDMALLKLRQRGEDDPAVVQLTGTYHNLLRMWADT